jgi:hypothetical protein
MTETRKAVLNIYKRIIKAAFKWSDIKKVKDPINHHNNKELIDKEKKYIESEARKLFRANKNVTKNLNKSSFRIE